LRAVSWRCAVEPERFGVVDGDGEAGRVFAAVYGAVVDGRAGRVEVRLSDVMVGVYGEHEYVALHGRRGVGVEAEAASADFNGDRRGRREGGKK
jgi:hypothetical protein